MRVIAKGDSNVIKLLGKQKVKPDFPYRLMRYTLRQECDKGLLLHNVITGKLILLDSAGAKRLDSLPGAFTDDLSELIEDYFVVPDVFDEQKLVDTLRMLAKRVLTPEGVNSYVILPTTCCNARCFYCYESQYEHINMSNETTDRLIEYIITHKGGNKVHIQWFGGEPLLGIKRIDQISQALSEKGIEYDSNMISNGYLFDEEIVKRAVESWHLRNIQITLDGTEEIYNRTKAYVNPSENPYRRVLRNIQLLIENGIHVGIRMNLDQHNYENLDSLITEIHDDFGNNKHLRAYVHVVYENEGFDPMFRDEKTAKSLFKRQVQLNSRLEQLGITKASNRSLPKLRVHSCMADSENSVAVYPDGRLFKCEHFADDDVFGSIFVEEKKDSSLKKYQEAAKRVQCNQCELYPSCLILENCEGLKDRNSIVCGYDVEKETRKLLSFAAQYD